MPFGCGGGSQEIVTFRECSRETVGGSSGPGAVRKIETKIKGHIKKLDS